MTTADQFSSVSITQVIPGKELPCDIYLKINNKFIKYLTKGDSLESQKYDYFMGKSLLYLYILGPEEIAFRKWIEAIKSQRDKDILKEVGIEHQEIWDKQKKIEALTVRSMLSETISDNQIDEMQNSVADFIKTARGYKTTIQVVAQLRDFNNSLAGHSLNVANLSVFCAMILGKVHHYLLENIYLGAILHDYGKIKIDPHILENKSDKLFSHAINMHPLEGAKILRRLKKMPEPVFMIIEQHEEMYDGSGYPRGIKDKEIYELSAIVSFCNALENIINENVSKLRVGQQKEEAYSKSLKAIALHAKRFHPQMIEKGLPLLEKALIDKSAIELEFNKK